MLTLLPTQNSDVLLTLQNFFRQLLDTKAVQAVLVALEDKDGEILPALVVDPDRLASANPLAPVMPQNTARLLTLLTGKGQSAPLGAVLRPCEIRALIELVKLQQASLENLLIIGIDCLGTYERSNYHAQLNPQTTPPAAACDLTHDLQMAGRGEFPPQEGLRPACQICTQFIPEAADLHIQLYGTPLPEALVLEISPKAEGKIQPLDTAADEPLLQESQKRRQEALKHRIEERRQKQAQAWEGIRRQMQTSGLSSLLSSCIACHNCKTVCPICYCKTCLFETASFEHEPDHFLQMAQRKGAARLPGDTLLFHLTRLMHMSASCVGCGMCTSACPAELPVSTIFSAIGAQVQSVFNYYPGRSTAEPLPLTTFQIQEWMEIGERD